MKAATVALIIKYRALIAVLLVALGLTVALLVGHFMSDMLIFHKRGGKSGWLSPSPAECQGWTTEVAFQQSPDLVGTNLGSTRPSCQEALRLRASHRKTLNRSGLAIHYAVFASSSEQANPGSEKVEKKPLWVHFHGLNGNYLHGARYFQTAEDLGFQLVAVDLSNHGISDHDGLGAAYGCKEKDDVVAVIRDLLITEPGRNLLISGSSMGAMAVSLAEEELIAGDGQHRIVALALENPIPSVEAIVSQSEGVPRFPAPLIKLGLTFAEMKTGFDFEECAPIKKYPVFSRPTLVQHSEQDEFAPVALGKASYQALPSTLPKLLRIYPRGRHSAIWNSQKEEFESDLAEIWKIGLAYRDEHH